MARELRDEFEENGGGGAPAVSWFNSSPGDEFTGIVVPPKPLTDPAKGHEIRQRFGQSSLDKSDGAPSGLLYFRPRGMEKGGPILADEYYRNGGTEDEMTPVPLTEVTCVTDYRAKEFFSGPALQRAEDDENFTDTGLRRLIIDGPDLPQVFREALAKIRVRKIEPGSRITCRLDKREPNKGSKGSTRRHSITITPPTPDTKRLVEAYVSEAKGTAQNAPAAAHDEEPPF